MYSSVVISMLTRRTSLQNIDSLQDLQQLKSTKILIRKHSFVEDAARSVPAFKDMSDRFEFFDFRLGI